MKGLICRGTRGRFTPPFYFIPSDILTSKAFAGYVLSFTHGPLAQLVEHLAFNQRVAGSIPARLMFRCSEVGDENLSNRFTPVHPDACVEHSQVLAVIYCYYSAILCILHIG